MNTKVPEGILWKEPFFSGELQDKSLDFCLVKATKLKLQNKLEEKTESKFTGRSIVSTVGAERNAESTGC